MLTEQIKEEAEQCREEIIQLRRELHRHPEPSMEEYETSRKIAERLYSLEGMEVITGVVGGTGVVGILTGAKGAGKTVLLRADIDTLPIEEKTGLPFSSETPGIMHAYGYDGHAAWPLGSAITLPKLCSQLSGHVKFVFQSGEENGIDGREMVEEDHILKNPAIDAVLAAHAWPEAVVGEMCVAERCAFGYPGRFKIQMIGQGGHGSWLYKYIDPIAITNQIYSGLQQIVSRRLLEVAVRVLSICTIHSGSQSKRNIIPNCCTMTGTLRLDKLEVMEQMEEKTQRIARETVAVNGTSARVTIAHGRTVINSPAAVRFCLQSAARILGKEHVKLDTNPHLGGEDFGEYVACVPGAYVYAGIATEKNQGAFGLHSSSFMLEGSVIPGMAAVSAQFAVDFLEKGGF